MNISVVKLILFKKKCFHEVLIQNWKAKFNKNIFIWRGKTLKSLRGFPWKSSD